MQVTASRWQGGVHFGDERGRRVDRPPAVAQQLVDSAEAQLIYDDMLAKERLPNWI